MIVADRMLWRIVWKEYRVQRGFWLAIVGAAVGLALFLLWLIEPGEARNNVPWMIAVAFPLFFALGSSAVSFASEAEEGTTELLRVLAARTSRVYLGKIVLSLFATLAMLGILLAFARIVTWGNPVPVMVGLPLTKQLPSIVAFIAQLLAWGFVFSLLCRKVLTAVCLAGIVSPISATFAHALVENALVVGDSTLRPGGTFLLFLPPLATISYLLTGRMLSGASWEFSLPRFSRGAAATVAAPASREVAAELDRLAAVRETAPAWRRMFARLAWLEFRELVNVGHVLWIVGLWIFFCYPISDIPWPDPSRSMFGVVSSALLMGIWAFPADGGRRTRFLADHGLSPVVVWLARHAAAVSLTLAATVPFLVAVVVANQGALKTVHGASTSTYHTNVPGASALAFAVTLACLAYTTGQLVSMLIPRAITAGFIGSVVVGLLMAWTWLLMELRIPLAISALPVCLVLLATTFSWSRHWLLEQATRRSWTKLATALFVSSVAVWGVIGIFRVYEVPHPDFLDGIAVQREAQGRPITPQEAETANLYRQALAAIKWDAFGPGEIEPYLYRTTPEWNDIPEPQRRWLADNRDALHQCLAATQRPDCAFDDLLGPLGAPDPHNWSDVGIPGLAKLILLSARELESEGRLDEALDRYVAALRLARHAAGRGGWLRGMVVEKMVGAWIFTFAAHPDQTPERLDAAVERVSRETSQLPLLRDTVLSWQFRIQSATEDDWTEALSRQNPGRLDDLLTLAKIVDRCFPWERTRMKRVLELFGASQLRSLDLLEEALRVPGRDMQELAKAASAVQQNANNLGHADILLNRNSPRPQGREADSFFAATASGGPGERIPWNWVNTTPLFMQHLPADHFHIWQLRLTREVEVRVLRLRLKLAAFKKRHGEYPAQVDFAGFGMDAIDPYTGTEFGYRPQGYQKPVYVVNGMTFAVVRLESQTALLWSAGPGNVRLFTALATDGVNDPEVANQILKPATSPLAFPLP